MEIRITPDPDKSIGINHYNDSGEIDASYIAADENSALLVVNALLRNEDPPRDDRKSMALQITLFLDGKKISREPIPLNKS